MPAIQNAKHERFAQSLAKGKSQADAYAAAGYSPSEQNANRLTKNDKVQARVAELQDRGAIRAEITLEGLIREAGEIQEAAKGDKQYSAATAALTAKAKLAGLWVDKNENTNRNVDPTRITDAELAAVVEADSSTGIAAQASDKEKPAGLVH